MQVGKILIKSFLIVLVGLLLVSCNKFNKLLKSNDAEAKYQAAVAYYQKKDFYKAGQLFDDLLQTYRGTVRAEEVYYYYANCKYFMREIPTAAFHFRNFYETYPNSQYTEECFFKAAYCTYVESYPYNLDPTYTKNAIDEFQLFVNVYPQSPLVDSCNKLIDQCRGRLQTKAYKIARLYYKIEDYNAAKVSFKNLLKDYPDLGDAEKEESTFLVIKSAYKYAEQSIPAKQEERYREVLAAFNIYTDIYPQGQYLAEATDYYEKAKVRISKLETRKDKNQ